MGDVATTDDGDVYGDGVNIGARIQREAAPGQVVATGYLVGYEGYGNVVLVDVGEGYATMYAHLERATVKVGHWVTKGDLLGHAGCTGSCTGEHLHVEVRVHGKLKDPRGFIGKTLTLPLN